MTHASIKVRQRPLPSLLFIHSSSSATRLACGAVANSGKSRIVCSYISSSCLPALRLSPHTPNKINAQPRWRFFFFSSPCELQIARRDLLEQVPVGLWDHQRVGVLVGGQAVPERARRLSLRTYNNTDRSSTLGTGPTHRKHALFLNLQRGVMGGGKIS